MASHKQPTAISFDNVAMTRTPPANSATAGTVAAPAFPGSSKTPVQVAVESFLTARGVPRTEAPAVAIRLMAAGEQRQLRAGEPLFLEGAPSDSVSIVTNGSGSPHKGGTVIPGKIEAAGGILGAQAFRETPPPPRGATVKANDQGMGVLVVPLARALEIFPATVTTSLRATGAQRHQVTESAGLSAGVAANHAVAAARGASTFGT